MQITNEKENAAQEEVRLFVPPNAYALIFDSMDDTLYERVIPIVKRKKRKKGFDREITRVKDSQHTD